MASSTRPGRAQGRREALAQWLGRTLVVSPTGRPTRTANLKLTSTFQRSVEDGHARLTRTWPALLATGAVGGADISLGVFAFYIVVARTHSQLLGALGFSVGFVAITLSASELFTENFLVPVAAVVAKDASVLALARLWVATLAMNLLAAWIITALIVVGFPNLRAAARAMAHHGATQGFGTTSLANAVVAGAVITLMTWMERSTESVFGKLAAAVMTGFHLMGAS